jgi:hypothetical protein
MLKKGVPGIGYINGPDGRPATKFRTGYIPEYADAVDRGVDVRHLAEQIASTPIELDQAYRQVLEEYGWEGGGVILDSDELIAKRDAEQAMADAEAEGQPMDPLHALAALMAAGVVQPNPDDPEGTEALTHAWAQERHLPAPDPDDMTAVLTVLQEHGTAGVYDLMEVTGLSALNVRRAVDALESTGRAAKATADQYVPCALGG